MVVTEEQIWEYLDGAADEATGRSLAEAIASGDAVADLYHDISAMHAMLKTMPVEELPPAFTDRVMAAVGPQSEGTLSIEDYLWSRLPAALPFILLAALLILILFTGSGTVWPRSFHINEQLFTSAKRLFILADVILLLLFLEELFYSKQWQSTVK